MDKIIYGFTLMPNPDEREEIPIRIAYLGNGEWEIQVDDDEIMVCDELEEAMRQLKEQNPE